MRLNAFFPTRDIGSDPAKIRDWAQAAEDLGYAHIEVPDHVFGATARDGWVPIYNEKDAFHETFVTIGFLAAVTKSIGLTSGVLISPQRRRMESRRIRSARYGVEDAWRAASRTGRSAPPTMVAGPGQLQRAVSP